MPDQNLIPIADSTPLGWSLAGPGPTHWEMIDDDPDLASTADGIVTSTVAKDRLQFTTLAVNTDQITLRSYVNIHGSMSVRARVSVDGASTWSAYQSFASSSTSQLQTLVFAVSGTAGALVYVEFDSTVVGMGPSFVYASEDVAQKVASPPTAPSDLAVVDPTQSTLGLVWSDNSGDEVTFRIERSLTGTAGWSEVGSSPAGDTTFTDAGLSANTTYYYRVRARNGAGDSAYSAVASGSTLPASSSSGSGDMAVTAFVLINPDTGLPIPGYAPLWSGVVLNLAVVGRRLNIQAVTDPCLVGSVVFTLNAATFNTDNNFPYALAGAQPDCTWGVWLPVAGAYTLTATPYTGANATGDAGVPLTINFTVVDDDSEPGTPEPLEGWTTFTESGDTVKIYVSSSTGNDTTGDGSEGNSYATIAKAKTLLRANMPDWIYPKKGDTFAEAQMHHWSSSGKSAAEPKLITSYGTGARPIIDPSPRSSGFGSEGTTPVNYVAVVGLDFKPSFLDYTASGWVVPERKRNYIVRLHAPMTSVLFEDCRFQFGQFAAIHAIRSLAIRRCVFHDSYWTGALYMNTRGNGWKVEGGIFHKNGWHDDARVKKDRFVRSGHHIYGQLGGGRGLVRKCIFDAPGHYGVQLRDGGVCEDNTFIRCPLDVKGGTTSLIIRNNVSAHPVDLADDLPRGYGPEGIRSPDLLMENNYLIAKEDAAQGAALTVSNRSTAPWAGDQPPQLLPINPRTRILNNVIHNWGSIRLRVFDGSVTMTGNVFVAHARSGRGAHCRGAGAVAREDDAKGRRCTNSIYRVPPNPQYFSPGYSDRCRAHGGAG